jgi:hypothetical protein
MALMAEVSEESLGSEVFFGGEKYKNDPFVNPEIPRLSHLAI